jgi:hypothetical protein
MVQWRFLYSSSNKGASPLLPAVAVGGGCNGGAGESDHQAACRMPVKHADDRWGYGYKLIHKLIPIMHTGGPVIHQFLSGFTIELES